MESNYKKSNNPREYCTSPPQAPLQVSTVQHIFCFWFVKTGSQSLIPTILAKWRVILNRFPSKHTVKILLTIWDCGAVSYAAGSRLPRSSHGTFFSFLLTFSTYLICKIFVCRTRSPADLQHLYRKAINE